MLSPTPEVGFLTPVRGQWPTGRRALLPDVITVRTVPSGIHVPPAFQG